MRFAIVARATAVCDLSWIGPLFTTGSVKMGWLSIRTNLKQSLSALGLDVDKRVQSAQFHSVVSAFQCLTVSEVWASFWTVLGLCLSTAMWTTSVRQLATIPEHSSASRSSSRSLIQRTLQLLLLDPDLTIVILYSTACLGPTYKQTATHPKFACLRRLKSLNILIGWTINYFNTKFNQENNLYLVKVDCWWWWYYLFKVATHFCDDERLRQNNVINKDN